MTAVFSLMQSLQFAETAIDDSKEHDAVIECRHIPNSNSVHKVAQPTVMNNTTYNNNIIFTPSAC